MEMGWDRAKNLYLCICEFVCLCICVFVYLCICVFCICVFCVFVYLRKSQSAAGTLLMELGWDRVKNFTPVGSTMFSRVDWLVWLMYRGRTSFVFKYLYIFYLCTCILYFQFVYIRVFVRQCSEGWIDWGDWWTVGKLSPAHRGQLMGSHSMTVGQT